MVEGLCEHVNGVLFSIAVEPRGRFRFTAANRAFFRATGLKPAQVIGRLVGEVVPEPSLTLVLKNYRQAVRTKEAVTWLESTSYPSGTRHGEVSVTPVFDAGGRVIQLAGIVHDVTERKNAEDGLKLSEERYMRAMNAAQDGLWERNLETGADYFSPKVKQLLGFAPTARLGKGDWLSPRIHPDDQARVARAVKAHLEQGVRYDVELRLKTKDGTWRWFRVRGQAEWNAQRKPLRMTGSLSDITSRKVAEQALTRSEEWLRAVFEQASVGFATFDAAGRFLEVNQRYCSMTGRAREELLGSDFVQITHEADRKHNVEKHRALVAGKISEYMIEKRYVRPDGSVVWGNVRATRIKGSNGSPDSLLAVVEDITDRKIAEAKYHREVEFNEILVNHTSVIIVLLDPQGRMLHVNDATVQILGYSREELQGRTPWAAGMMNPEEAARSLERLRNLLATGEYNPPREALLKAKNGEMHVVALSSVATRTQDGEVDRIIVTGTDLTERYRLQQEILRISEQEQARIGHNLHDGVGQTMTGVASLMEALEGELNGAPKASATRIRELIQEAILEVRRMSHGLSPAAVRNRGLGGALELLAETVRTNHRVACTCKVDLGIVVDDQERQTHVFRIAQEAANNALRHGKPKNVTIQLLRLGRTEGLLVVEDDGAGMRSGGRPASDGIGLRVMDYRAALIGGSLEIKPRTHRGVSVVCRFPTQSPAESAIGNRQSAEPRERNSPVTGPGADI